MKDEIIKPKKQVKILGFNTNEDLSMIEHANSILSQVNHKIAAVSHLAKYMDFRTRLRYADSHLISTINYGLPLFVSENEAAKNKINKAIMNAARFVHQSYCFRVSRFQILDRLNWKLPEIQIKEASARLFHKINYFSKPEDINNKIRRPRSRRNADISMKVVPKTKPFSKCLINSMASTLNSIPDDLRYEKPHLFKVKLKKKGLKKENI